MYDSEEERDLGIGWPREQVRTQKLRGHGHCEPVTKSEQNTAQPHLPIAPLISDSWVDELLVAANYYRVESEYCMPGTNARRQNVLQNPSMPYMGFESSLCEHSRERCGPRAEPVASPSHLATAKELWSQKNNVSGSARPRDFLPSRQLPCHRYVLNLN